MTTLDFLRHGEPAGGSLYRGHGVDDPLSEPGWGQMWAALGDDIPFTRVVSSPLQRCLAFAETVAREHGLSMEVEERFKEVGFGIWEGRRRDEVRNADPEGYAAFYEDPLNARPPGAEPLEEFVDRVRLGMESVLTRHYGERVLVVAHAGVMRAALALALEIPLPVMYRLHIPYAGRIRLAQTERGLEYRLGGGAPSPIP